MCRPLLILLILLQLIAASNAAELKVHDLTRLSNRSRRLHTVHTEFTRIRSGGEERPAIFLHAGPPDAPAAELVFPDLRLPRADRVTLRFAIGFKDGKAFSTVPGVDGCDFVIRVNGRERFREIWNGQAWKRFEIDLTPEAGQRAAISLITLPRANNSADWAAWAEPVIVAVDEPEHLDSVAVEFGLALPRHWPLDRLRQRPQPDRIVDLHETSTGSSLLAVTDRLLDLSTALKDARRTAPPCPVPLAPRLVVGQGPHPDNHTVVRVLDPHGITAHQFLAFPPSVKGGVQVEVIQRKDAPPVIATAPFSGSTPRVRLFNPFGGFIRDLTPPPGISPPLVIAADRLLAVTSRRPGTPIALYHPDGQLREILPTTGDAAGPLQLTQHEDRLHVFHSGARQLVAVELQSGQRNVRPLHFLPAGRGVHFDAHDSERLWAGGPQPLVSHVYDISKDGSYVGKDVGREENTFWIALPKEFEKDLGRFTGRDQARHIRLGVYGHIRVEGSSPGYARPRFEVTDPAYWGGAGATAFFRRMGLLQPLDRQPVRMWNPCFSHRQFRSAFKEWALQADEQGLKQFTMTGPTGSVDGYGGWEEKGFVSATYAPGATALWRLYTGTLRAFLRGWAPLYRRHPSLVPSIEPNHEHEIAIASDQSLGDYNPAMIAGFHDFLRQRHGDEVAQWNRTLGTTFTNYFDAPRHRDRHPADNLSPTNAFAREWLTFNRQVIDQTLALTYREALLAGIPPEMIHCHQIPDRYAVGDVWRAHVPRISGIDYAQVAGVGYGFTRFGTFHQNPDNVLKAARKSGFDSLVMGEYQPLTTDPDAAWRHLEYVFTNGVRAIHPLYWSQSHNPNFEEGQGSFNETVHASIQRLLREDPRRPGQAGGIGQVRPFTRNGRRFNLAVIGAGEDHTGLIKSLHRNGTFEGSVYVVPFHAHVDVQSLPVGETPVGFTVGPLAGLLPGTQVEVRCEARKVGEQPARFSVTLAGKELPGLAREISAPVEWGDLRVALRVPTTEPDGYQMKLTGCEIRNVIATRQTDQVSRLHPRITAGTRHRGSITFAVLD